MDPCPELCFLDDGQQPEDQGQDRDRLRRATVAALKRQIVVDPFLSDWAMGAQEAVKPATAAA